MVPASDWWNEVLLNSWKQNRRKSHRIINNCRDVLFVWMTRFLENWRNFFCHQPATNFFLKRLDSDAKFSYN